MAIKLIEQDEPHEEWLEATTEQMMDTVTGLLQIDDIVEWNILRGAILVALRQITQQ